MKRIIFFSALVFVICSAFITADGGKIPVVTLKDLSGKQVSSSSFTNHGKPIIISFWATWCKPCKKELDAIAEEYPEWQKETGVKLIAVSIDDARSSGKVATDVKAKGWKYEVYLDENQDLKRAMDVASIPYTFLVDGRGNIVWSHNTYSNGDEAILYENVKRLVKGEKLEH